MPKNMKTILVPMDSSEPAERAFSLAAEIASHTGAKMILLFAIDPEKLEVPTYAVGIGDLSPDTEPAKESARRYLEDKKKTLPPDTECEIIVREGRAEQVIEDLLQEKQIDLVIMGNSGKGTISSFVTGSVSYYTIHHAKCPVLIVK